MADKDVATEQAQNKWLIFALCAAAYFFVYLNRMSTAAIVTDLKREFAANAAQLGFMSSANFYVYAAMQVPVGIITNWLGPKRTILGGLSFLTAGAILFAASGSLDFAIFARIVTTIGAASILVPSLKLFLEAFGPQKFATAAGLILAVGNSGGLAASSPLALLVQAIGWRGSFLVIAVATLAIFLLVLFFLRAGMAIRSRAESRQARAEAAAAGKMKDGAPGWWGLWLVGFIAFFSFGPLMSYQGLWGIPFFMDVHGLTRVMAGNIIALTPIGNISGNLLTGLFVDRFRLKKGAVIAFGTLVVVLAWILLVFAPRLVSSGWAYPISFFIGMSTSIGGVVAFGLIPTWMGNRNHAVGMGVNNALTIGGGAVFQIGMGVIINQAAQAGQPAAVQYHSAFLLPFFSVLIAFVLGLVAFGVSRSKRVIAAVGP